jgi:L-ascorbate metabolism protein UlaG (beta-lactamase superfamily)
MKLTRFAQSCVLIKTRGKKILIDPGYLLYKDSLLQNQWADVDAIFVTHKHKDHCFDEVIGAMTKNSKTKFYTTSEVAREYPTLSLDVIKEGDDVRVGEVSVEVVRAVHGYVPTLKGGREVYENVGYIIDDGDKRAYHTSDSICFENDYKCDVLFVPVVNHGLVMGPYDAALFSKETGASLVIPFHYDNPAHPANFMQVEEEFKKQNLNYKILSLGESIEV